MTMYYTTEYHHQNVLPDCVCCLCHDGLTVGKPDEVRDEHSNYRFDVVALCRNEVGKKVSVGCNHRWVLEQLNGKLHRLKANAKLFRFSGPKILSADYRSFCPGFVKAQNFKFSFHFSLLKNFGRNIGQNGLNIGQIGRNIGQNDRNIGQIGRNDDQKLRPECRPK